MINNKPSTDMKRIREIIEEQLDLNDVSLEFKDNSSSNPSIKRLRFRNVLLDRVLRKPISSNITKSMKKEEYERKRSELYSLQQQNTRRAQDQFNRLLYSTLVEIVSRVVEENINDKDLSTSTFLTSVAEEKAPNYYISQPKEHYTQEVKLELFEKMANTFSGQLGDLTCGLYVPQEGLQLREILENSCRDLYNINIASLAEVRLNLQTLQPFEYLFFLLDRPMSKLYKRKSIPNYHLELFICKGRGPGKYFYSHYIIPNLSDVHYMLYHGDRKYVDGNSKIRALVLSLLAENWHLERDAEKKAVEPAHMHVNRFLYHIFVHRMFDVDSILLLEDLKARLINKVKKLTPISYLDEVLSWVRRHDNMKIEKEIEDIRKWAYGLASRIAEKDRDTLDRFMMDLRSSNIPHDFANAIVNNLTVLKRAGIDTGEIPFELQFFSTVTQFKQARAVVLATFHNVIVKVEKEEVKKKEEEK